MFDRSYVTVMTSASAEVREEVEGLLDSAGISFRESAPALGCIAYPGPVGFVSPREINIIFQNSRSQEVEIQVDRSDLGRVKALIPDYLHLSA